MKTKVLYIAFFVLLTVNRIFAQDVTVRANSYDISDNLDLKAVASIFGESKDLEDFERRLNDPNLQISNLDLNGDNRVDYLRVVEATQDNAHLIILQAVLGVDTFQDVATIEVERDRSNAVTVQIVGDSYIYGPNYIYEPVYVVRPPLFNVFWVSTYRPYYSPWYWGYYPVYYTYWAPYPVYRYRHHVYAHIDRRNTYRYTTTRRNTRAAALYTSSRRQSAYERQHPDNSFTRRTSLTNRYALEESRQSTRSAGTRNTSRSTFNNASRNAAKSASSRSVDHTTIRNNGPVRASGTTSRSANSTSTRSATAPSRTTTPSTRTSAPEVRSSTPQRVEPSRSSAPVRTSPAPVQRSSTPARSVSPSRSSSPSRSVSPAPRSSSGSSRSSSSSRHSRG